MKYLQWWKLCVRQEGGPCNELLKTMAYRLRMTKQVGFLKKPRLGDPTLHKYGDKLASRLSLYDTQVNATDLSVTDKLSAHESCFNQ